MKILTAIDFSEATERVVAQGKSLASAYSAQIILLHVPEPSPELDLVSYEPDPLFGEADGSWGGAGGMELDPEAIREAVAEHYCHEHGWLQQISQAIRDEGMDSIALLVPVKSPDVILTEVEKHSADMMVMGLPPSYCLAVLVRPYCTNPPFLS